MKINKHNQAVNVDVTEEEWEYLSNLDCCQTAVNNNACTTHHIIDIQAVLDDINQHEDIYKSEAMTKIKAFAEVMQDAGYTLFIVDL